MERINQILFFKYIHLKNFLITVGRGVECPNCGWKGRQFLKFEKQDNVQCPKCFSHNRHRFHKLLLNGLDLYDKKILHIAPELCISNYLQDISKHYISIDIDDEKAMLKYDIRNLPFPDSSFDFIYCSHVLEHIENVDFALNELYRVLSPSGKGLFAVPIWPIDTSIKYETANDKEYGHWWKPGRDWHNKYGEAGFSTSLCDPKDFDYNRFGLLLDWDVCAIVERSSHDP